MSSLQVALVAAVARNRVIGRDGAMPWHLPQDLKHFRQLTVGHPVVMGRRTWESLPARFKPLPERDNWVVSRQPTWHADGATRAYSLSDALSRLQASAAARVFVIGGATLYHAALPLADRLLLTEIDAEFDGDTHFPTWDRAAFIERERAHHPAADGLPAFDFVDYVRQRAR